MLPQDTHGFPPKKFSQIGPAVEPAIANISENTG